MAPLRIVSASLLGLAITASCASAECAWVLWSVPVSKDETSIAMAANRGACHTGTVRGAAGAGKVASGARRTTALQMLARHR